MATASWIALLDQQLRGLQSHQGLRLCRGQLGHEVAALRRVELGENPEPVLALRGVRFGKAVAQAISSHLWPPVGCWRCKTPRLRTPSRAPPKVAMISGFGGLLLMLGFPVVLVRDLQKGAAGEEDTQAGNNQGNGGQGGGGLQQRAEPTRRRQDRVDEPSQQESAAESGDDRRARRQVETIRGGQPDRTGSEPYAPSNHEPGADPLGKQGGDDCGDDQERKDEQHTGDGH